MPNYDERLQVTLSLWLDYLEDSDRSAEDIEIVYEQGVQYLLAHPNYHDTRSFDYLLLHVTTDAFADGFHYPFTL